MLEILGTLEWKHLIPVVICAVPGVLLILILQWIRDWP